MTDTTRPAASDQPSVLFDRVGDTTVAEIVDRFYSKVFADPELRPFFEHTSMPRLRKMQAEFFAASLGAPMAYSGNDIHDVHAQLGIDRRHFSRFVELLIDAMHELEIDEEVVDALIGRLSMHVDDVVGGEGEAG